MAADYYAALGVSRNATADELQQAYRKLARRYHPDINHGPGAEDRFKEINEAYSVLSDPSTRRRYDRFGEDFRQTPEDYDERVAAAGGGGPRTDGGFRRAGGFDSSDMFDDLFGSFFARGAASPIPLRRYMAPEVETRIAKALLRGDLTEGVVVRVDVRGDELVVRHNPQPATV